MPRVRCALVRGGTSKGVVVERSELPDDPNEAIRSLFGGGDPRQIDGLGGATSTTSKLMIVDGSDRDGVDIEYTFAQVGVAEPVVDYGGNCGNMTAAVGPFAVDEGLVDPPDGRVEIRLYNTNTGTAIDQRFDVSGGRAVVDGEYAIDGVPGTGAPVETTFRDPGGATTGELFPLGGPTVGIDAGAETVEATVLDVTVPVVFVRERDLGIEVGGPLDGGLRDRLERIRASACVDLGFASSRVEATSDSPAIPKLALVADPRTDTAGDGPADARGTDLEARMLSMGRLHPTYAVTGAACTAAGAMLPGTIPNEAAEVSGEREVTIGHPRGTMSVGASVDGGDVHAVTAARTQRRLMSGTAFYRPADRSARSTTS